MGGGHSDRLLVVAMAGRGRKFTFHGAYGSKAAAVREERAVGGFIRPTMIRGHRRYMVLTRNPGRKAMARVCGVKYAHGVVNKWCERQRGHSGPHAGQAQRKYRRNPKETKWLAFALIGFGAFLLLRPRTPAPVPVVSGGGGTILGGFNIGNLSNLFGQIGNLFGGPSNNGTTGITPTGSPSPNLSPAAPNVLPSVAATGQVQYDSQGNAIGYAFVNEAGGQNVYDLNGNLIGTS